MAFLTTLSALRSGFQLGKSGFALLEGNVAADLELALGLETSMSFPFSMSTQHVGFILQLQ